MIQKVAFALSPIEDTKRVRAFHEERLGLAVGSERNAISLHQLKAPAAAPR